MPNNPNSIDELLDKIELLSKKQALFQKEINDLQSELYALKYARKQDAPVVEKVPILEKSVENEILSDIPVSPPIAEPIQREIPQKPIVRPLKPQVSGEKSGLEKFIGEKLINIIGILILVIGVVIGTKYAIDNELISPLTRIILGYIVGIGLMAFAIKLKANYLNFSAVLLSGAMAIMYFITFAAYSFYALIPQNLTFGLMVLFTIFTVIAALNYEKQVIAHIGLVGAYAIPFLLSDGSGKVLILFSYMAIINAGILAVAVKKYWKALYYVAFSMTWLIFGFWFFDKYQMETHFSLAFSFLTIFFVIFYAVALSYKLIQKEVFSASDVIMLLINSFIFYGIGYVMLNKYPQGIELLGLFTLGNAIIHFGISAVIYQQKLADKNLFFMIMGLVLAFITIAIPVQLEGHWVVLLWSVEAALLFWIGREKEVPFYEKLSYIMMVLATYCLSYDWLNHYHIESYQMVEHKIKPIFNPQFLSSLVFIIAFSAINYLNNKKEYLGSGQKTVEPIIKFMIPAALLGGIYFAFHFEILNYFNQNYQASMLEIKGAEDSIMNYWNEDIRKFGNLWLMNYSMLFATILAFANIYLFKNRILGILNLVFAGICIFLFLTNGLVLLSELRESHLHAEIPAYYKHGVWNIGIRYVCYGFVAASLTAIYLSIKADFMEILDMRIKAIYDILLFGTILWIASTELITWVEMSGSADSFKLGLSVFWGVYALLLIILGFAQKKKHLRFSAIALFAVTLFKLFFYDLESASTIAKTIIFISLGILLLIISFLYNKYKHLISDEAEI